uniref:uncharacterized protein LOC101242620 n=1 Tax=Ciona intestinalis TaxID=7719 RepID=UPI000EF55B40|nr:uncharacterized protein LOC101242620 [Ciona intestinalis]XP_026695483.1 uncharacterized protein LOC101242620 [Ciona intestinalis]XP_026695484.1 uncharacterized protein LOC101242620 [Ciona intestinalis]XP_026695485.1 uncharacterized protein LOC101242620 [Ciona intestinalis]|eukprot:XP_026695482.1 uncharacterized protein LOC101242620 [Ciona intestinalis]
MVVQSETGLLAPIHVQKHVEARVSFCSNENCSVVMKSAVKINPAIECPHLDAVKYSVPQPHIRLRETKLEEMKMLGILSPTSCSALLVTAELAGKQNIPIVVKADFYSLAYSSRFVYYSVFSKKEDYYSKLGRVRVTFDSDLGIWSCECPLSSSTSICTHQSATKWYEFQMNPAALQASNKTERTIEPNKLDKIQLEYLLKAHRIPEDIEEQYLLESPPPAVLVPIEESCPCCSAELTELTNQKCTIFGVTNIWKGIQVVMKQCTSCKFIVRYQNYRSGFHNFNNKVMLSLRLCIHLLKGIQFHVNVESNLKILFDENVPINNIRNGFTHFCAMRDCTYEFSCLKCGFNPQILIGDGNWANCCKRPVDAIQSSKENCQDRVNCEDSWENIEKEILGRGLHESANNPFKLDIKYNAVSPWIGKYSRASDYILDTEHKKCSMLKQTKLKPTKFVVSQEEILDALHKKDAKSLKVLCNQLGVSCTGSTEDVVNNLHELCLFKDIYPKLFKRIKKCGGGVVHFRCPHGVCYYFKTLLRHESARDYIDGLLSFKVQPTVFVSDIAAQVAHHGENRKQGMFGPNKGMLYEWNEQNIEKSNNGELLPTEIEFQDTTAHYSLFDKFHMFSKKKDQKKVSAVLGIV